jgi:hypothetical protein
MLSVSCKTENIKPVINTYNYQLGDKSINLQKRTFDSIGKVIFIQLHHNELTAEKAAIEYLQKEGGVFVNILNSTKRLINFNVNGIEYTFDPNRIFTKNGIDSSLKLLSHSSSFAAKEIEGFAHFVLEHIPDSLPLIALHNNTDGRYSIDDYKKGGSLEKDAAEVYVNNNLDKDDFIFTTDKTLYDKLKTMRWNVILQNSAAKDDGSLSIYCAKVNRKYINIEVQTGHLKEQLQMLKSIKDIFKN